MKKNITDVSHEQLKKYHSITDTSTCNRLEQRIQHEQVQENRAKEYIMLVPKTIKDT